MNLPAINITMKNHNSQFKQDNISNMDGFGLGIQVFKIESVKNMDTNFKSKNRTAIKNIENPIQSTQYKPPIIPKPKRLASIEKSKSQANPKQRFSAYLSTKMQVGIVHQPYTGVIVERKQPYEGLVNVVTPVSHSMRKKVGMSTEKNVFPNQTAKPFHVKQVPNQRISTKLPSTTAKLNQTAPPPQIMYKPQQLYYTSYHYQHQKLNKFYFQYQNSQKQFMKQLKQLKTKNQTQIMMDCESYDRMESLQSIQGRVIIVVENMEKQEWEERNKELVKGDEKRHNKKIVVNNIVPITGFEMSEMEAFQEDSIEHYFNGDYSGSFKISNFENIDLAPATVQPKEQQQQDD